MFLFQYKGKYMGFTGSNKIQSDNLFLVLAGNVEKMLQNNDESDKFTICETKPDTSLVKFQVEMKEFKYFSSPLSIFRNKVLN